MESGAELTGIVWNDYTRGEGGGGNKQLDAWDVFKLHSDHDVNLITQPDTPLENSTSSTNITQ